MDTKLVALKLFLDSMGIPADIQTVQDRKRLQKAVYLAQAAGADLGYRFSWYLMGPYCSSLTEDYYAMDEKSEEFKTLGRKYNLHETYRTQLSAVREDIKKPEDVALNDEEWLELLASYHYLRRVSRQSHDDAAKQIEKQKTKLFPFLDQAVRAINDSKTLRINP